MMKRPLLRFGVVADVQYADSDDKQAWYNPLKTRFYRNSLNQMEKAFQYWQNVSNSDCKVSFILQLGDIIDALNTSKCSQSAIHRTLNCFLNNPQLPTFHTVGNHELYNFNRSDLSAIFDKFLFNQNNYHSMLNLERSVSLTCDDNSKPLYYKFNPIKGVKFISLDTYDISVLGYESTHWKYKFASEILEKYHGHTDVDLWDTDDCLVGSLKRFQSSNGLLSEEQLKWLNEELEISDQKNEMVIVFGHVGLHPQSCGWDSILWNYDQVIECFNKHSSVVAYFSGHAHNSGYAYEGGIHYIVLHGIIETDPASDAFSTVTIYEDHIDIDGKGVEQKFNLSLPKSYSFDCSSDFEKQICELSHIEEVHMVEINVEV